MIEPASLIGFGLVLVGVSLAVSIALGLAFLGLGPRLRGWGAYAERTAAALAIGLPPLVGFGISGALAARSLLGGHLGIEDHCLVHDHHLHLCLFHGATWARQGWAVAVLAGACAAIVLRMGRRLVSVFGARLALRRLAQVAQPIPGHRTSVSLAPADTVFCFTAGVREPRIFVSTAAWDHLDSEERRAVIEHEIAHVGHGDIWFRALLGAMALFGAPFLTGRLLAAWDLATERACDQKSARVVGNSAFVASALVKLARAAKRQAPAFAASFPARHVVERVESVLRDGPDGARAARHIALWAFGLLLVVLVVSGALVDPLHHAVETLLGTI